MLIDIRPRGSRQPCESQLVGGVTWLSVTGRKGFPKSHRTVAARPAQEKPAEDAKRNAAVDDEVVKLADKIHANA
jgi:hypothetical protein